MGQEAPSLDLAAVPALVLCGGRGSRLGELGRRQPKSLLPIHGRPILWYILGALHAAGFRRFVLPLGFRGADVRRWVEREARLPGLRVDLIDTGTDTPIAERVARALGVVPDAREVLLTNGDTLLQADFGALHREFVCEGRDGLALTVPVPTSFGVIVSEDGRAVDFVRESRVRSLVIEHDGRESPARVYSGTSFLRRERFERWLRERGPEPCEGYEQEFYGTLCREGRLGARPLGGFWCCFDTPRDVARSRDPELAARILALRARIEAALPPDARRTSGEGRTALPGVA